MERNLPLLVNWVCQLYHAIKSNMSRMRIRSETLHPVKHVFGIAIMRLLFSKINVLSLLWSGCDRRVAAVYGIKLSQVQSVVLGQQCHRAQEKWLFLAQSEMNSRVGRHKEKKEKKKKKRSKKKNQRWTPFLEGGESAPKAWESFLFIKILTIAFFT